MGLSNWFNGLKNTGVVVTDPTRTTNIVSGTSKKNITTHDLGGILSTSHMTAKDFSNMYSGGTDAIYTNPFTGRGGYNGAAGLTLKFSEMLMSAFPEINVADFATDPQVVEFTEGDPITIEKATITLERLKHITLLGLKEKDDPTTNLNLGDIHTPITLREYVEYYDMSFRFLKLSNSTPKLWSENPYILSIYSCENIKAAMEKINPCAQYFKTGDATNAIIGINLLASLQDNP